MVEKKKIFSLVEREGEPNRFTLSIDSELCEEFYLRGLSEGSYLILYARLMNMSYATWLRFCRDILGAELIGKNSLYVYPVFKKTSEVLQFIDMLNAQINLVKWEKENPDWKEHQEYLEERKGIFNGKN